MKHRASSTHRMDAPDRHDGQTDKRTCLFVRSCLLPAAIFTVCRYQVRIVDSGNASSASAVNSSVVGVSLQQAAPPTTILVTQPTSLSTNAVYRVVYTNLLYFVVMFLVPLVVLIILNGELIRVLRDKKAKRAQLMRGRSGAPTPTAAGNEAAVDTRGRCALAAFRCLVSSITFPFIRFRIRNRFRNPYPHCRSVAPLPVSVPCIERERKEIELDPI